ncbi:MAG: tetratricopeptide repeat protein [Polyangiaceae bacterium]|nr:tetratricopeptide repeat protein [Polyangiaceae bacterium]MCL4750654.1 hypothetical protein [Myxococcales bacterium]
MSTRSELETLTRDGLIERARRLGVPRPEVMTRVEMTDEIIRRQETDAAARRRARGWLGVARDLVASLIEQGLNMPDAAELVRQGVTPTRVQHQAPVATVTLAEIYAAQGHVKRALGMLDQVLDKEPDHAAARALRDRLGSSRVAPMRPVDPEEPEEPSLDASPSSSASEAEATPAAEPVLEVAPAPEPVVEPAPAPEATPVPEPVVEPVPEAAPAAQPVPEAAPAAEPVPQPAPAAPAPVFEAHPERDLLVLVTGPRGVSAFWDLSDKTRALGVERRLVLRVCALSPSFGGAKKIQRDVGVEAPVGSLALPGLGADAVVRATLGYERGGELAPLVIACVVGAEGGELTFCPIGAPPPDPRSLARAERACA